MFKSKCMVCVSVFTLGFSILASSNNEAVAASIQIDAISANGLSSTLGRTFSFVGGPAINNNGDVAFSGGDFGSGGPFRAGIFRTQGNTIQNVVATGDLDTNGEAIPGFIQPIHDFNDNGDVAFGTVDFTDPNNVVSSAYRTTNAGTELIIRTGSPGPTPGSEIIAFNPGRLNAAGEVLNAVSTGERTSPTSIRLDGTNVVRFGDSGAVTVFEDDTIGGSDNSRLQNPTDVAQNAQGDVLFRVFSSRSPNERIVTVNGNGVQELLTEGTALPNGDSIDGFFPGGNLRNSDLNENGDFVVPVVTDAATNNEGILKSGPNGLEIVALEGDSVPGTSETFSTFQKYSINNSGQVAFAAQFEGTTLPGFQFDGIFTTDAAGDVVTIATVGQVLEVAPGDSREVIALDLIAGSALNDDGIVAFRAEFDNFGSGIFRASILEDTVSQVPVPAALPLMLTGMILIGIVGKRKKAQA